MKPFIFIIKGGVFMWKRVVLSAVTLAVILLTGIVPNLFLKATPSIEYVKPKYENISEKLYCNGVVEPTITSEIYLQTPAIASEVNVSIGDYVNQGDILARVDTELTKSVLTGGEAVNGNISGGFELNDFSQLQSVYEMAQMAGINLTEVIEQYQSNSYSSPKREAQLYIIEELTAPIGGVVTEVNMRSNVLSPNQKPMFTVVDNSKYKVVAQLKQSEVERVSIGSRAEVSFNENYYNGIVTKIYPTAKKSTSLTAQEAEVSVEIEITEVDSKIKAGYNVSVTIILGDDKKSVMLPFEAVMQDDENIEYVYVLSGSQTVRKDIITGNETAEGVEVLEGLNDEDIVVYKPYDIIDGEKTVYIKGEAQLD